MTYSVEQHIALMRVPDVAACPCGTLLKPRNIVAWYVAAPEFIDRHLRR